MGWRRWLAGAVVVGLTAACTGGVGRRAGGAIEVMGPWTGAEAASFQQVLDGFRSTSGTSVTYLPAPDGVPEALAVRMGAGRPPDVAFLPQPGVLRDYAARHLLVPLGADLEREEMRRYGPAWTSIASVGGQLYGVWFKAADKSLVWYSVAAFERAGVVPPADLAGLVAVAGTLSSQGVPAFSVAGGEPWTLTDWFENLYLRVAGPARYDLLAAHRIPWTDPSVTATLTLLADILAPAAVAGGLPAALATTFPQSVDAVFARPPRAAMTMEGDFVAGVADPSLHAELGVDVDVFAFPAGSADAFGVVGGGDVAVALRSSPSASALLSYLTTPSAAARWARRGGFISPNLDLDLSVYPDAITRTMARSLLQAGDAFRFDLSDLQPTAFGSSASGGMQAALRQFLVGRDAAATAARLEEAAAAAWER